MKKLNLIGQTFSRLTVIDVANKIGSRTAWKCLCECGTTKIIKTGDLMDSSTKSCGCLNNEQRSARAKNMYSKVIKYSPIEASARRVWKGRYSEMPFDSFYKLSQLPCYYCNSPPSNSQNDCGKNASENRKVNGTFTYNGLDRFDNNLTHTIENCVPCCKNCNYAKNDRTYEDFKSWAQKLYVILHNDDTGYDYCF